VGTASSDPHANVGIDVSQGNGPLPTADVSVGVHVPGLPIQGTSVSLLGIGLQVNGS
jgi:hypothetical protein